MTPVTGANHLLRAMQEARRAAFFRRAGRWTPYLAAQIGEEVFLVRTGEEGLQRGLFVRRSRSDISTLGRALAWLDGHGRERRPDSIFLEVGANIGTTTIAAIRRFGFASAVALEPSPENFRGLRLNLLANDVEDYVTTFQVAAGGRMSVRPLDTNRSHGGGHRLAKRGKAYKRKPGHVDVRVVTLNKLLEEGVIDPAKVGLLWIDAAGDEARVICGATRLLKQKVPIVASLRPRRMKTAARQSLVDVLQSYQYGDAIVMRQGSRVGELYPLGELLADGRRTLDVLLVPADLSSADT